MKAIAYRQPNAFNPTLHRQITRLKLERHNLDLAVLQSKFKVISYTTTNNFCFELGFGAKEAAHTDLAAYQAILILDPNGWVLKGPRNSHKSVYQKIGDLVLLNQRVKHEIIWDRHYSKPEKPWIYLLIDSNCRRKWLQEKLSLHEATSLALAAVEELSSPVHLQWLTATYGTLITS